MTGGRLRRQLPNERLDGKAIGFGGRRVKVFMAALLRAQVGRFALITVAEE
jgi:hypothetical protein